MLPGFKAEAWSKNTGIKTRATVQIESLSSLATELNKIYVDL